MFINPEKELYPLLKDLILTMKRHLPSNYHGTFKFEFKYRDGEIYEVADVWGRRTFDVKKLISLLGEPNRGKNARRAKTSMEL